MNVVDPAVLRSQGRARAPTCTTRWPRRPRRSANLRGIVLASDGDWNEGPPPVQAAARLRMQGRAGLRRAGRQPDAAARRRAAQPRRADLRRRRQVGPRPVHDRELAAARVRRRRSRCGPPTATRSRRKCGSPPMGRTTDWIVWKPKATGDFTLTLDVPKHPDETLADNNKLTRADRDPRGEAARCWSSSRTRAGSIATCGTPSRATRASRSRACSSTRA